MTLLERVDLFPMAVGFHMKARMHQECAMHEPPDGIRGLLDKAPETVYLRDAGWQPELVQDVVDHVLEGLRAEPRLRRLEAALCDLGAPLLPFYFEHTTDTQGNVDWKEPPAWPLLPTPRIRLDRRPWVHLIQLCRQWFKERSAAARNKILLKALQEVGQTHGGEGDGRRTPPPKADVGAQEQDEIAEPLRPTERRVEGPEECDGIAMLNYAAAGRPRTPDTDPRFLWQAQAAEELSISGSTLFRWATLAQGQPKYLRSWTYGRRRFYYRKDIEAQRGS